MLERELQEILGFQRWDNFTNTINQAKKACENAQANIDDHFRDIMKMITIAKGAQRDVEDVALTRYACYKEHIDNNKAVRAMLIKRGVKPETLPPAEDVKKIERRLESDEKKALKNK
jgi:hypothetical protein